RDVADQLGPMASQYSDAARKLVHARAALRLLEAHATVNAEDFNLTDGTVDAARAAEAEALALREELRHSVREIGEALQRRLQLALGLRLADRGEYGAEPVSVERVGELVAWVNQAGDSYETQHAAMEAIAVLDRMLTLRDAAGETPLLSEALNAQKQALSAFV